MTYASLLYPTRTKFASRVVIWGTPGWGICTFGGCWLLASPERAAAQTAIAAARRVADRRLLIFTSHLEGRTASAEWQDARAATPQSPCRDDAAHRCGRMRGELAMFRPKP